MMQKIIGQGLVIGRRGQNLVLKCHQIRIYFLSTYYSNYKVGTLLIN